MDRELVTLADDEARAARVLVEDGKLLNRYAIFERLERYPGATAEDFLTRVVTTDADAMYRQRAAVALAAVGGPAARAVLAECAANDPVTDAHGGSGLMSRDSARAVCATALTIYDARGRDESWTGAGR